MDGTHRRVSLARVASMSLVTAFTCAVLIGVQVALGPLGALPTASSSAPPALEEPDADSSDGEPTVELLSAPKLPLPVGATQFFIAPAELDLEKFTFVYATFPGDLPEVARDMEERLAAAGWRVRPGPRQTEDSFVLFVRTPDRSASGQLEILPLAPTPSGHKVQIVGGLELALSEKVPSSSSSERQR